VPELAFISTASIDAVRSAGGDADARLALLADVCRLNALVAVKQAGSGHLGSSFSALDVVVSLLYEQLNVAELGFESADRDVFFSSKGHDVPGLYAALYGLGVIPAARLARLRRLGGLDGHPDVGVPGIEANSGSLGMGISKGRGIAWGKRLAGRGGVVVVLTGDGELQEGQNWEALQGAAHDRLGGLWVVVDRNSLQSDRTTEEILALGDLEAKLRAFGWEVERRDGHDHTALREVFTAFRSGGDAPKALVADTIKGRGVSFMEHPVALKEGGGLYRWHAGAPGDEPFDRARDELASRIADGFAALGLAAPAYEPLPSLQQSVASAGEPQSGAGAPRLQQTVTSQAEPASGAGGRGSPVSADGYVVDAYGQELVALGAEHPHLVVLDADLASDCRVRGFELAYPGRFLECGIAEQDMVSAAAGLARHGFLPVVNSFASFLASRANEQIYNQASEGTKVVYALHYAGVIPAGPGKSHQSIRDVSLLGALPDVAIVQPGNAEETRALLRWAVEDAEETVAIRLAIGPSPRRIDLDGAVTPGRWRILREGGDALLVAYGPVMLHEALTAAEVLDERGVALAVASMPWLNRIEPDALGGHGHVFVLEDHAPVGGLGDALRRAGLDVEVFGVEGWPACGTPGEALRAHGLDGASLAGRIAAALT
jgi:transketolase